jgi:hypothetical protein
MHNQEINKPEATDRVVKQTFVDVALNRVRLPGYYNALFAQAVHANAPEEFAVEPVGIDINGQGVYVLYWLPPAGGQAN